MTKSLHGGKREGAGRKRKPPDERRDQVFSIKLTLDEKQLLDDTDARSWARDTLMRTATRKSHGAAQK
jgi:hypothetical protein